MTTSIAECPHCHHNFNFELTSGVSVYSIRLKTRRILKLIECKQLQSVDINQFSSNHFRRTHGDNSKTATGGNIWALPVGPLFNLAVIDSLRQFTVGIQSIFTLIVLITHGIISTMMHILHLYLEGRYMANSKVEEVI